MSGSNRDSEGNAWGWWIGVPLFSILVLYLPYLIAVSEFLLCRTSNAYEWMDSVGLVKLLDPLYKATTVRLLN